MPAPNPFAICAAVVCALGLAGCASTSSTRAQGHPTCEEPACGESVAEAGSPLIVRSKGLGVFRSDTGFTMGWLSEWKVYLGDGPDDCRVVIVLPDAGSVERTLVWLKANGPDLNRICLVPQGE